MDLQLTDVALRLGCAALAGAVIGINRDLAQKPIGVRTLGLVALGASTVTVATIQVQGIAENVDALSRVVQGVIQGVMAGISVLGAGVILSGTAALGIACGLGMWGVVAIAAAITLILLVAVGWLEVGKK